MCMLDLLHPTDRITRFVVGLFVVPMTKKQEIVVRPSILVRLLRVEPWTSWLRSLYMAEYRNVIAVRVEDCVTTARKSALVLRPDRKVAKDVLSNC